SVTRRRHHPPPPALPGHCGPAATRPRRCALPPLSNKGRCCTTSCLSRESPIPPQSTAPACRPQRSPQKQSATAEPVYPCSPSRTTLCPLKAAGTGSVPARDAAHPSVRELGSPLVATHSQRPVPQRTKAAHRFVGVRRASTDLETASNSSAVSAS